MATNPQIITRQETLTAPEVDILDPRGAALFLEGQKATVVGDAGQFGFTEGPVWVPARASWIFSDIPKAAQHEYTPSSDELKPFRIPSGNSNGNFLSNEGDLLTCEHANR
jgi:gluconolactonase